jgi:Na+-transporting methylmalonyl-CoA/oxaloacetate decarboxylase gamma subunit
MWDDGGNAVDRIVAGLGVSVLGITVTFAAMGLLALIIVLLQRYTSAPPGATMEAELPPIQSTQAAETEAIVAAVAVALAHLRSLESARSELGSGLVNGPGTWWGMGQIQQHRVGAWHLRGRR